MCEAADAHPLAEVSARVVWFEPPAVALADLAWFIAYAMRYATPGDKATVRRHFGDDGLRAALDAMPPGIIDGRSWSYWHAILGRFPPPPLSTQQFE